MPFIHPVFAIVLAALFALLLVSTFGWRHPRRPSAAVSFLFILALLFPLLWSASIWLVPAGPALVGVAVFPLIAIGIMVALIVAVLTEPRAGGVKKSEVEAEKADTAANVYGILFWILMLVLVGTIILGYQ